MGQGAGPCSRWSCTFSMPVARRRVPVSSHDPRTTKRHSAPKPRARVARPVAARGTLRCGRLPQIRMTKRTLLTALIAVGLFLTGLGVAVVPASADQRTLLVTLLGGDQITVTVNVPAGTPVDRVKIPGVTKPIVSIQDVTAAPQPQPTAPPETATEAPAPTQPAAPPSSTGAPQVDAQQQTQQTT